MTLDGANSSFIPKITDHIQSKLIYGFSVSPTLEKKL